MKLVELNQDESLAVQCRANTGIRNVVDTAQRARDAFRIKSVVIMFNEQVIQVDRHGVTPLPRELQMMKGRMKPDLCPPNIPKKGENNGLQDG